MKVYVLMDDTINTFCGVFLTREQAEASVSGEEGYKIYEHDLGEVK